MVWTLNWYRKHRKQSQIMTQVKDLTKIKDQGKKTQEIEWL